MWWHSFKSFARTLVTNSRKCEALSAALSEYLVAKQQGLCHSFSPPKAENWTTEAKNSKCFPLVKWEAEKVPRENGHQEHEEEKEEVEEEKEEVMKNWEKEEAVEVNNQVLPAGLDVSVWFSSEVTENVICVIKTDK